MPSPLLSNNNPRQRESSRIISIQTIGEDDIYQGDRINAYRTYIVDDRTYEETLRMSSSYNTKDDNPYQQIGGADLSSLFIAQVESLWPENIENSGLRSGYYPDRNVSYYDPAHYLIPYELDINQPNVLKNISFTSSGDALPNLVNGEAYVYDTSRIRAINEVRSVGLRMPTIAVGWGLAVNGVAFPNNDDIHGFETNPSGYIAAPFDNRYDPLRGVWSCEREMQGLISASPSGELEHIFTTMVYQHGLISVSGFLDGVVDPGGYTQLFNTIEETSNSNSASPTENEESSSSNSASPTENTDIYAVGLPVRPIDPWFGNFSGQIHYLHEGYRNDELFFQPGLPTPNPDCLFQFITGEFIREVPFADGSGRTYAEKSARWEWPFVVVKIGETNSYGQYLGKMAKFVTLDFKENTSDFTELEYPDEDDCEIINADEAGLNTYWVGEETYAIGWRAGFNDASKKTKIIINHGHAQRLEPTTKEDETGDLHNLDKKDREANIAFYERDDIHSEFGAGPVNIWVVTRVACKDKCSSSSSSLSSPPSPSSSSSSSSSSSDSLCDKSCDDYTFLFRKLSFDGSGRLVAITEEVAVDCCLEPSSSSGSSSSVSSSSSGCATPSCPECVEIDFSSVTLNNCGNVCTPDDTIIQLTVSDQCDYQSGEVACVGGISFFVQSLTYEQSTCKWTLEIRDELDGFIIGQWTKIQNDYAIDTGTPIGTYQYKSGSSGCLVEPTGNIFIRDCFDSSSSSSYLSSSSSSSGSIEDWKCCGTSNCCYEIGKPINVTLGTDINLATEGSHLTVVNEAITRINAIAWPLEVDFDRCYRAGPDYPSWLYQSETWTDVNYPGRVLWFDFYITGGPNWNLQVNVRKGFDYNNTTGRIKLFNTSSPRGGNCKGIDVVYSNTKSSARVYEGILGGYFDTRTSGRSDFNGHVANNLTVTATENWNIKIDVPENRCCHDTNTNTCQKAASDGDGNCTCDCYITNWPKSIAANLGQLKNLAANFNCNADCLPRSTSVQLSRNGTDYTLSSNCNDPTETVGNNKYYNVCCTSGVVCIDGKEIKLRLVYAKLNESCAWQIYLECAGGTGAVIYTKTGPGGPVGLYTTDPGIDLGRIHLFNANNAPDEGSSDAIVFPEVTGLCNSTEVGTLSPGIYSVRYISGAYKRKGSTWGFGNEDVYLHDSSGNLIANCPSIDPTLGNHLSGYGWNTAKEVEAASSSLTKNTFTLSEELVVYMSCNDSPCTDNIDANPAWEVYADSEACCEPGPPEYLDGFYDGSDAISIIWDRPSSDVCPLEYYQIKWRKNGGLWIGVDVTVTGSTSYEISGIPDEGDIYEICVRSCCDNNNESDWVCIYVTASS